ncbi:MAG: hypothetical protein APF84_09315 [Gracilibacter sp. BRH_c7a]|nr:MAG: hypothetical protein APF84_09315 [Gracilibacter sp. BRH_c7a]
MNKISHKLILGMLFLTAITIVILWLYQVVFLEAHYLNIKTKNIKTEMISLESLYEKGQLTDFQNRAESIAYTKSIGIELLDLNGRLLYSAGDSLQKGQNGFGRSNIRDTIIKNTIVDTEFMGSMNHPRFNTEIMIYSKLVESANNSSKILMVSLPIQNISETTTMIKQQILYIIGVLIILSILLGTFVSRTLVKPILKLNESVQAMAAGDLHTRIESHSKDEIGRLTANFNIMAEEINRVETLRKELIANVSHELRTPLGLIRGYAEMVRDISSEEKRADHLNVIINESERLGGIVNDILDLSQLQSGYVTLRKETFDLTAIATQTLQKYSLIGEKNNISLSFSGEDENVLIHADITKIEQVLHNLIANALNHTPPNGIVNVSVRKVKGKARIQVQDSGTGIPREDIKHIWERYYKTAKLRRKVIQGTGLGLAIVSEILKAHDYEFGVTSEAGKGSLFFFEAEIVS